MFYARPNRHSFNALAGALETDEVCGSFQVFFADDEKGLVQALKTALASRRLAAAALSFATAQCAGMRKLMSRLRAAFSSRVIFIAGGPHPSAEPAACLRMGFDVVVRGEGEAAFIELLKTIAKGGDYRPVNGLAFTDGEGQCHMTPPRPAIELDRYPSFSARYEKIGPVEITRGCPFACRFCQTTHLLGAQPRHRSIGSINSHLALMRRRGMCDVRFVTPNAFSYGSPDGRALNYEALHELLAAMRATLGREGRLFFGTFPSEARPEHVTEKTLKLVRDFASNDNLVIGAQSGSQRMLDACHRGHSVADIERAVALTLQAGLKANVDFILGLPGETDDDTAQTLGLIRRLITLGAKIHAHTFMPLPQTGFAFEQPSPISERLLKLLHTLIPAGGVYGQWQAQKNRLET